MNDVSHNTSSGEYPEQFGFPAAFEPTGCRASFRGSPEDFRVDEIMSIERSGEGEHWWLHVEKRGCNTDWVAKQLAQFAEVQYKRVSYAGLKDRHAVTTQWFSIHIPGKREPDWNAFKREDIRILETSRHNRKLQRGALAGNRFDIVLRNIEGDISALGERCALLATAGVPNYFGEQRFGHNMQNLAGAHDLFSGGRGVPRHKRSIMISAARSLIFNEIVAERIRRSCWSSRMDGDVYQLEGSNACFANDDSSDIESRLEQLDIHPTAAMWGKGDSMASGELAELETGIAARYPVLAEGLCKAGMKQQRRAARVLAADLQGGEVDWGFRLSFSLPSGAYATSVLAELCMLNPFETC